MNFLKLKRLKILSIGLCLLSLMCPPTWAAKKASIAICAETGAVYHTHQADVKTYPASLTKMMTLYLAFKALREGKATLKTRFKVSAHAARQSPTKLGLKKGTTISMKDAILALITKSANDAAVVLAEGLGKSTEAHFAKLMTAQARKLGMKHTVFKNASGLPNKHQVTTARDMATLSRALYAHFPKEFKYFGTKKFSYKGKVYNNHNKLLASVKGVDGIKTGFINASGFNLAASMVRNNKRIIAVVMGGATAKARDKKMTKLLETTFSRIKGTTSPRLRYASIGDIIHSLGPSEARADALPQSIDDILGTFPPHPTIKRVSSPKPSNKVTRSKKNPQKSKVSAPKKRPQNKKKAPSRRSKSKSRKK